MPEPTPPITEEQRAVAEATGLTPHRYQGLGHMCHPDDFVECCRHFGDHPIHHPDLRSDPNGQ